MPDEVVPGERGEHRRAAPAAVTTRRQRLAVDLGQGRPPPPAPAPAVAPGIRSSPRAPPAGPSDPAPPAPRRAGGPAGARGGLSHGTPPNIGRVHLLQRPPSAEVHVDAARQARVEAADGAHDVDALEVVRAVLLEDRHVLRRRPRTGPACRSCRAGWRSTGSAGRGGSSRSCRRGSPGGARARRAPPRGSRSRSPRRAPRSPGRSCVSPVADPVHAPARGSRPPWRRRRR